GGEVALAAALERAVSTRSPTGWEIDQAVLAAAQASKAPALRNRLAPTLRTAQARRARGFTSLRDAVCLQSAPADLAELQQACAAAVGQSESRWESERNG